MSGFCRLLQVGLLLLFCTKASLASDSSKPLPERELPVAPETSLELNQNGYSKYIADVNYPKISLDDNLGILVASNKAVDYIEPQLYRYYRKKVCEGVFWFNCNHNVQSISQNTGIDLTKIDGLITRKFENVSGYQVVYTTHGSDGNPYNVSGAILIPKSPTPLKGVIIYYHAAGLNRKDVPSNFNGDEYEVAKLMASTLASDGYVVLLPDYIGLGGDKEAVSPYMLYPSLNALSGIYMLKLLPQVVPALRFELKNRHVGLYLTGYTEGAEYALWAAKILQENKPYLERYGFNLQRVVGLAGTYNLSKVMLPYLYSNIKAKQADPYNVYDERIAAYSKPAMLVNMLNAYAAYSESSAGSNILSSQFYSCNECKLAGKAYDIGGLLNTPANEISKYEMLYNAAKNAGYSKSSNSVNRLVSEQLLADQKFMTQVSGADIYNWQASIPVNLVTLEFDSLVPRLNSEVAYTAMTNQKSSQLEITQVPNRNFIVSRHSIFSDAEVDHNDALKFLILFARNDFDTTVAAH